MIDKVAWLRLEGGKILGTRSRGKDVWYLPGGKREPGETDVETLVREIAEELTVVIDPGSAVHVGTFEAQAHGHAAGVVVRMTCYGAEYAGTLAPSNEIAELAWLTYADRDRVSPVDQLIFDDLHRAGRLR
ncbi:NUDIX hydrolase [Actinophytocola sp. KF-1]